MTKLERQLVKSAIDADRLAVDLRIQLRQLASMCRDARDERAEALAIAAVRVLEGLFIRAVKTPCVEVDESK